MTYLVEPQPRVWLVIGKDDDSNFVVRGIFTHEAAARAGAGIVNQDEDVRLLARLRSEGHRVDILPGIEAFARRLCCAVFYVGDDRHEVELCTAAFVEEWETNRLGIAKYGGVILYDDLKGRFLVRDLSGHNFEVKEYEYRQWLIANKPQPALVWFSELRRKTLPANTATGS